MNPKTDWTKINEILEKSRTPEEIEQRKKHKEEVQALLKQSHLLTDDPQNLAEDTCSQEHIRTIQERAKKDPGNDLIQALHIRTIKEMIELDKETSAIVKKMRGGSR